MRVLRVLLRYAPGPENAAETGGTLVNQLLRIGGDENCSGCGTCVERCQVNGVTIDDGTGVSSVNLDRCIGCGNCVVSCPTDAITLLKKEKETVPPPSSEDLYDIIMANKKGKLGRIKLAARLLLKK